MSLPYDRGTHAGGEKPKQEGSSLSRPDDDLPYRTGRVHIAARRRGVDVTALGGLALHLPQILTGLAVVLGVSYAVAALGGPPWWVPAGWWALSGALVFHRPCERLAARWLLGLRHPTPEEDRRLRAVWREVTARAGVDGDAYQLWVEERDGINAMAAAGHIVGVTRHSLRVLPSSQLAGVLAHELGHHTRGHAWASLLVTWYALPGRLAWRLLLRLLKRIDRLSVGAAAVVTGVLGATAVALATATYGLVLLPLATPYLAAALSRRSELRADEHAAGLGFAQPLMTLLHEEHEREAHERASAAAVGARSGKEWPGRERLIARLLDSHPDAHTRLHHLQARLNSRR
ncbi:peptidase [Streptomyces leeuwenhoekii]|uniref:Peptidase n=1 Tax=Streptomyces leeuwenhoekii TaxID=1437453 RepID=A0ABR5HWA7_STRLW|nr:M48 family metalloprotease [Streptomyces leeuwenhoekii]KMS77877.1 peptidase [Streptomyces leeuwenhoekii]